MPTVKVQPWGDGQGDHVLINAEDFDEVVHTAYVDPDAPPPGPAEPEVVDIPEGWATAHWMTRAKLAKALGAPADVSADKANEIIAAEVARRAAAEPAA